LLAVVGSGYLVRILPFSLPLPLVQIGLGAVIAGAFRHGVALDPAIFFLLFLPQLLKGPQLHDLQTDAPPSRLRRGLAPTGARDRPAGSALPL